MARGDGTSNRLDPAQVVLYQGQVIQVQDGEHPPTIATTFQVATVDCGLIGLNLAGSQTAPTISASSNIIGVKTTLSASLFSMFLTRRASPTASYGRALRARWDAGAEATLEEDFPATVFNTRLARCRERDCGSGNPWPGCRRSAVYLPES